MIKVVIAEDKPLILRSIKEKIQSYSPEVSVVGEAMNGGEALSIIESQHPDIVFTDIRMPMMDGLQLIAEARRVHPEAEFVIISGHDEFEYARQAMKLNVQDYLLKPVETEELHRILKRLADTIAANKGEREREALHAMIHSNGHGAVGRGHRPDCPYYLVVLLQAGSYSNFIIDFSNPFNSFWSTADFQQRFEALLLEGETCWHLEGKTFNEQIAVIGGRYFDGSRIGKLADGLERILATYDIPITAVISRCISGIEHLAIKTQFLRASLRNFSIFGKPSVMRQKEWSYFGDNGQDMPMLDASLEKKLTLLIRGEKKEAFLHEIRSLFERWETSGLTQVRLENLIKQLIRICQRAVHGMLPVNGNLEMEVDEVISISKDYGALFQGLSYVFDYFFAKSDKHKGNRTMLEVVRKVETFLNDNYQSPITIHDIARMVNFHPGYVSKIFKSVVGVSPMEYLTNQRINKAKELMRTSPELTLKEIADMVGYSNPFYFSRIFKLVTGMSPSEYKDEMHRL
jgi:two-component system response regulator YesN